MTTLAPMPSPSSGDSADGYLALRAIAEAFEDIQRLRIMIENRVRFAPIDADLLVGRLDGLADSEHQFKLLMKRTFRKVIEPEIVAWQAETVGIGEHMLARLLGVIGHPVRMRRHEWETPRGDAPVLVEERDRTVSELWSYCGHGDPNRRKHKGMSAEEALRLGSPRAKMLVHLLAEGACKEPGRKVEALIAGEQTPDGATWPYRVVYEETRLRYLGRVHATPCVRCGPSGKPAAEGSPWSPAHQHAAALRLVGKEILRDLWTVAR